MRDTIVVLILVGLVLFAGGFLSFTFGPPYDERHGLYSESIRMGYDWAISGVYGERWGRLTGLFVFFGVFIDVVAGVIWMRGSTEAQESSPIP